MTWWRHLAGAVIILIAVSADSATTDVARVEQLRWRADIVGNKATVTSSFRVTLLSAAGAEFGSLALYESKYVKVRQVELRLIGPNGKPIQKLTKKEFTKVCGYGSGFELYSDICHYYAEVTSPTYPATVEGEYTVEYESLFFLDAPSLKRTGAPMIDAELVVSFPENSPIAHKCYGLDTTPEVATSSGKTTLVWKFAELPKDPELGFLPIDEIDKPRLELAPETFSLEQFKTTGRTWLAFGSWYSQLAESQYLPASATTPQASRTREITDKIYLDLIKSTRYVAVSIGLSGWQPHAATAVEKKGYGDCKDLSTLLISNLRLAGITAYPVLVRTSDLGAIDPEFVNNSFNHVITCAVVGTDTLWYDPTCSECPPGDLPRGDEGVTALLIAESGGVLVRLPESRVGENVIIEKAVLTLGDSAFVDAEVEATIRGNAGHSMRNWFKHARHDDHADYLHDWLVSGDRRYSLTEHSHTGVDSIDVPLSVAGRLVSTRPLDKVKQTRYLNPFILVNRDAYDALKLKDRDISIDLGTPNTLIDSVMIGGPLLAACDSIVLPSNDSASFPGGKAVVTYARTDSGLIATVHQELIVPVVEPGNFGELQAYVSARRKLIDRPIKLYQRP